MVENIPKKDKSVNLLKSVNELILKSVRKMKLNSSIISQQFSPEKLSWQLSIRSGSQDMLIRKMYYASSKQHNGSIDIARCQPVTSVV